MISTPVLVPIKIPTIQIDFSPFLDSFAASLSAWLNSIWKMVGSPRIEVVALVLGAVLVLLLLIRAFRKPADR